MGHKRSHESHFQETGAPLILNLGSAAHLRPDFQRTETSRLKHLVLKLSLNHAFTTVTPLVAVWHDTLISHWKQVREVGTSVDFAYCSGHTKKGDRCRNVVNKSKVEFCDWHLSQGHKRLAIAARPECTGTVLGATAQAKFKENRHVGKAPFPHLESAPKTLGASQSHQYACPAVYGAFPAPVPPHTCMRSHGVQVAGKGESGCAQMPCVYSAGPH
jgi:hypothetical protein